MAKKQSTEEKRLDVDLTIIGLVTLIFFAIFSIFRRQIFAYIGDSDVSVFRRLLLNAALQFGIAGLGSSIVPALRKERLSDYGFKKEKSLKSIVLTLASFIPLVICIFASGDFKGYQPFSSIIVRNDVLAAAFPLNILGLSLIILIWGFFEAFNYVLIYDKINQRYPSENKWLNYGALSCALICLLFHQIDTSFWGIIELICTFIAIYAMLLIKSETGNAWGAVFAFCFIWNAI